MAAWTSRAKDQFTFRVLLQSAQGVQIAAGFGIQLGEKIRRRYRRLHRSITAFPGVIHRRNGFVEH